MRFFCCRVYVHIRILSMMLYSKETINSQAYFFVPDHSYKQAFMTILILKSRAETVIVLKIKMSMKFRFY